MAVTNRTPLALLPASYWANYTGRCPSDAVNCFRILEPWEIVSAAASILAITFHCFVFHFLLIQASRGHANFSSPFYKLYLVLSVTEIVTLLVTMLVGRLPNYGFFLDFFEGNTVLTKMDLSLNDYLAYFQWFTNCLIAANRFTVFAMPMSHKKIWRGKTIIVATGVLVVLPLPFFSIEMLRAVEYFYVGPDQLINYFVDFRPDHAGLWITASTSLFTSLLSVALNIAGLLAFKRFARKYHVSEENRKNLRLLFCSLLMLASQSIMTLDILLVLYGLLQHAPSVVTFATSNNPWIWDQYRWLSPVCLIITR